MDVNFIFIQVLTLVHGRVTRLNVTWPVRDDFSCCVCLSLFKPEISKSSERLKNVIT